MTPNFVRLAQLDDQHFLSACRHGLIHLTWGRVTVRLARDEFARLASLLDEAVSSPPPATLRDRDLRVTTRLGEECELQMGSLVLLVTPDRFAELATAARDGLNRLDKILASGLWDNDESESGPPDFLAQLRRFFFSRN
jgi:hypothetical protein